ncbi:MAG: VWA domain-containing protein [Planctomycetes bacterium]|nr:VWA domain-containing protein [Planctomycetota bacterium]
MSTYYRRLPIYLLLDCSESMAGGSFDGLTLGLATMVNELRSDPMALESAALSLITFSGVARQLVPLTEVFKFNVPRLKLGSGTALGAALALLESCLEREIVKTTREQKGDYKPVCFIVTDGEPTDVWEAIADRIRTTICGKKANVIGIGCGPDADLDKLRRVTDVVISMNDSKEASFSRFFKWVTASVSSASQALERGGDRPINLPDLPAECLEVAKKGVARNQPEAGRHFFLHARCLRNGGFFLVRYSLAGTPYKCLGVHPLDDFDMEGVNDAKGPQIGSEQLGDPLPCPYCKNPLVGACSKGHFHCCPMITEPISLTCPWCKVTDIYGYAAFGIDGGAG